MKDNPSISMMLHLISFTKEILSQQIPRAKQEFSDSTLSTTTQYNLICQN